MLTDALKSRKGSLMKAHAAENGVPFPSCHAISHSESKKRVRPDFRLG